MACWRKDYDPKTLLTSARAILLNRFMREHVIPQVNTKVNDDVTAPLTQRTMVELMDLWALTSSREDMTISHSDKIHPCSEVYREVNQVLLNMLCPK
ncbi:hypothetical protein CYMTET_23538 [Cymbomonas tetramitiformis]|nr:hypothetical protein CYMTET_23538 [Cymbomonas tetramitiformis]